MNASTKLSMNGKSLMISTTLPFVLRFSKDERSILDRTIKETIMRMTHRWLAAVLIFLVAVTAAGAAIAAQPGWEEVVKAAEKEGEVSVYATNSVGDLTVIWD